MDLKKLTKEVEKVSEIYSSRFKIKRDDDWFIADPGLSHDDRSSQGKRKNKKGDEKDFDTEVADVLGLVLLLANHFNVDVDRVMEEKWLKWNK